MPKHILVIDDEKPIRDVLQEALSMHGYTVTEAATAIEGLKAARDLRPDLIITDLQLEDSDGFEVAADMKKLHPEVPVMLLTGAFLDAKAVKAKLGDKIACFIEKSTRLDQIVLEVQRLIGK